MRNQVHVGEVHFRKVWPVGQHEPLVEPELFDSAGTILARWPAGPGHRRTCGSDYLLNGLPIMSDRCGHRFFEAAAGVAVVAVTSTTPATREAATAASAASGRA